MHWIMLHRLALGNLIPALCIGAILFCSAAGGTTPQRDNPAGTGGSASQTQAGPCAKPSGSYKVTFAVDSGNCGPQSSAVADLSKPDIGVGTTGGACQGQGSVSSDGCKYQGT